MSNIKFIVPPSSMMSGDDIFSKATVKELSKYGFNAELIDYWPDSKAKLFFNSKIPFIAEFRFYKWIFAERYLKNKVLPRINKGDIVWINANLALCNSKSTFEELILKKGGRVFFHTMDDWTLVKNGKKVLMGRINSGAHILVSTSKIMESYKKVFQEASVTYMQEPININRFTTNTPEYSPPIVVWTGSASNLTKYFNELNDILTIVNTKTKIKFRCISGRSRPNLPETPYPIEWLPFDYKKENQYLEGCSVGIANLNKTPYDNCKGNFKVKTYLAKGIPVVGTNWGYNKILIEDGANGFLVDSKIEFSEKIISILRGENPSLLSPSKIREKAFNEFSHESIIPKWVSFFKKFYKNI
jgi:glycosyltransferase involved in cell wall biosynthesis